METWLNRAFTWAELRDVPMYAWRSDEGDWHVTLEFKDTNGWFSNSVKVFNKGHKQTDELTVGGKRKVRKENDEEFECRIDAALMKACAEARKLRTEKSVGRPLAMRRAA